MSTTDTLKHYGETLVEQSRTGLLVALGAVDAAVERARTAVGTVRTRAEALPGEAQVQADLAAKEARTRAEQARARAAAAAAEARLRATTAAEQAGDAAQQARNAVTSAAAAVRPEVLRSTVTGLVESARADAAAVLAELAGRGEKVVDELRAQPVVRKIVGRTEQVVNTTVDTVAATVEDTLAEAADAVATASNKVTSVAQKTAARAEEVAEEVVEDTEAAAATTKSQVRAAAAKVEAPTAKPVRKPRAKRTAPVSGNPVPDPLSVPAKSTPSAGGAS